VKAVRALAWLALLSGCNGLLGLDEAHLDPTLVGSGGSDGGAPGGEGGAPGTEASLCEQYCDAITQGCTGDSAQYTDRDACLGACPSFPEGAPGDTNVNSLYCRLGYALKAPSEPITYCTWAGPGGDGQCGTNCEGFCSLMGTACTLASTGTAGDFFQSNEDCLATCETIPAIGNYCATDESITGGADIFECRLYHVAAAIYADDAEVHCPHAMGLALCVDK
jgi:hypothetical protein